MAPLRRSVSEKTCTDVKPQCDEISMLAQKWETELIATYKSSNRKINGISKLLFKAAIKSYTGILLKVIKLPSKALCIAQGKEHQGLDLNKKIPKVLEFENVRMPVPKAPRRVTVDNWVLGRERTSLETIQEE